MINALRVLFLAVFLFVAYTVIETSFRSNLFEAWSGLAAIPWMTATLKDFYALMLPVMLWMFHKEESTAARAVWAIVFVTLGSIGTSAYVLLQLMRVPSDSAVQALLVRKERTLP
jgi:uncharacterized membrane protein YczE